MNRSALALLLVSLGLSTGCEDLQQLVPTVSFSHMQLDDLSFEAADVTFVFDVENPNPVDIGLASFDYDLGLAGTTLVSGQDADGFLLSAAGGSALALPSHLDYTDIWDSITAARGADFVPFDIQGSFGFNTPIGLVELPYDEGGDFPALRTPHFKPMKLRVSNVNLLRQEATVELDVDVDNAHASTLNFSNLHYNLKLANTAVGSGVIPSFDVNGATEQRIAIPFTVNLLTAGTTVVNAITRKDPLTAGLKVDADVAVPFLQRPLALSLDETGDITVQ